MEFGCAARNASMNQYW